MKFSAEKIIIVGATSGIGCKLAEIYAAAGCRVGITGRRKELLDEIQKLYPGQIEISCFDVTEDGNFQHMKTLAEKLGGLDLVIISAGGGDVSKELDWEIDKITIETNVNGFAAIANWSFNFFAKQNRGAIAVISSIAANRGNSWAPAYSASKAFQSNYAEGLYIKARRMKKNIAVTCIEPGFVNTKMAKGNKMFWVVPLEKAARQIARAIEKRKKKVYISSRWRFIAILMRLIPSGIYRRLG